MISENKLLINQEKYLHFKMKIFKNNKILYYNLSLILKNNKK